MHYLKIISTFLKNIFGDGGFNPIFFKHIECCNFQTFTVMYVKVYIFEMEMSHRKCFFFLVFSFWKMAKKITFLVKIFGDKIFKKNNFEFKC